MLALLEARAAVGPARNLIEFARRARVPEPDLPGLDICITTYQRRGTASPFIEAIENAGVELAVIAEKRRFDLGILPQLRELAARYQPDVIQTHNVKSHLAVRLLGLWRSYPWVAFQHGYTATDWKDRAYNRFDRFSLRKAYRVVSVCQAFSARLQRWGIPASRIVVRHNPVKPFVPPPREELERVWTQLGLGCSPNPFLILSVGRLSREKGHRDLLETAAILRDRDRAIPLRFAIVGDGPERGALEQRCRALSLDGTVVFTGHQADVRPYYALARALALPSHLEGSPNVVLEAMAAGLAVAATRAGGVPEIVTDGTTGLLVPKQDPRAMADALARLIADPELRRSLGTAAKQLVTARYSVEAHHRAMAGMYDDIVASYYGKRSKAAQASMA